MRSRWAALVLLLLSAASLAAASLAAVAPQVAEPPPEPLTVVLDEGRLSVGPGQRIRFASQVRNTGEEPLSDLVAHVSILTSDEDVYVDPEDWSPRRTQFIDELAPRATSSLTWNVQAVTAGPIILYVTVSESATDTVAVSGPLYLTVRGQRVVDAASVLPLVLGVPAGVLLLLGLAGARRRVQR